MKKNSFAREICAEVARTAWEQICATTGAPVVMSWGVSSVGAGVVKGADGSELPCLVLGVSGLIHTGLVVVALDTAEDLYDVTLMKHDGRQVGEWSRGLYFDEIGAKVDALVERPLDMSDEIYDALSRADSVRKFGGV